MHPISFPSLDTGTSLSELWSDFQIRFSEVQPLMLKFLANEIFRILSLLTATWKIFWSESSGSLLNIQRSVKVFFYNGFRITGVHLHMKWFAGHSLSSQEWQATKKRISANIWPTVLKLSFGTGAISLSFSDIDLSQFLWSSFAASPAKSFGLSNILQDFLHTLFNRTYNHFFHFLWHNRELYLHL